MRIPVMGLAISWAVILMHSLAEFVLHPRTRRFPVSGLGSCSLALTGIGIATSISAFFGTQRVEGVTSGCLGVRI